MCPLATGRLCRNCKTAGRARIRAAVIAAWAFAPPPSAQRGAGQ
jgi:hypothetical protein